MSALTLEECELLGDSKYRAYISQVEKALKSFEYTSEWADLISALGKLNKVLQNHVKYPVIPKRVTIGKRLAQCLHPALPGGVHLKALETYDIIFKCIGTHRLGGDIFTYSAGLFPLLAYAAMNVKPALLALYETHFVPLGKYVKPALPGLLLALLPGLEEGAEHFDRTNNLLEEFCDAVEPNFFYGCLWECVLGCPSIRLAAVNFVLSHFNRKQTMEDQLHIMGTNIDLLVQALCIAVQDSSVLVQRSTLDFILSAFPLHNSQLTRPDLGKVITASVKVVLRRDMSLNRRLYAWLLGVDSAGNPINPPTTEQKPRKHDSVSTTSDTELDYFNTYAKDMLVQGVETILQESASAETTDGKPANLKPFRILISLLDKPEIGSVILEDVLIEIFRCFYKECLKLANMEPGKGSRDALYRKAGTQGGSIRRTKDKKLLFEEKANNTEIVKTANLLFGTFEPYFMWDFIARTFESACIATGNHGGGAVGAKAEIGVRELCTLVEFLLDKVTLETYAETQTIHLPQLLRQVTSLVCEHCDHLTEMELTSSLKLCAKILSKVQPSMAFSGAGTGETTDDDVFEEAVKEKSETLVKQEGESVEAAEDALEHEAKADKESTVEREIESGDARGLTQGPCTETDSETRNEPESVTESKDTDSGVDSSVTETHSPDTSGMDTDKRSADNVEESVSQDQNTEDGFSDFLQFVDDGTHAPQGQEPTNSSNEHSPQTLMQTCVKCFEELFCTIVTGRIIQDKGVPEMLMRQIYNPELSLNVMCDPSLIKLYSHLNNRDRYICQGQKGQGHEDDIRKISLEHLSPGLCEAFVCACKLLVEFSSFPTFCTDPLALDATYNQGSTVTFPKSLQLLITCACFVENFKIQSAAIATMLEFVGLAQSVSDVNELENKEELDQRDPGSRRKSVNQGTVSVVILPILSPRHLKYLNKSTYFYQIVALQLWSFLSDNTPLYHQQSVNLLSKLHKLAPCPWICEDVIGSALISDDKSTRLDAHKKFAVLWHLLRDQQQQDRHGNPIGTFDRSMFVMLDSLQSDINPCRALTQTWLTHAIQRGDVARILEPILLILLHPDTARISIQHVSIHQPKKVKISEGSTDDVEGSEAKIFAISSEGGNIIYHVGNKGKPLSHRTSEELRTFALTTITESGSSTQPAVVHGETELPFDKVNPNDLKLRVNPFGSANSLDKVIFDGYQPPKTQVSGIENAKRLDAATCRKEGIFFDDAEENEDADAGTEIASSEGKEETDEDFMRGILNEIIDKAVDTSEVSVSSESIFEESVDEKVTIMVPAHRKRELSVLSHGSSNMEPEELLNAIDSKVSEVDSQSETEMDGTNGKPGDAKEEDVPGIHPLHTHILLYTQKFDAQRTQYALSCLKAILNSSPRLVVCAIATTSISNANTPHLQRLQNLLVRHRRSVFGKNFFSAVPGDALAGYRSSMFLEILISVCLYFIRSYYPNLMMSKMTEMELNGNKEVQILSTEILTVLLSELINVAKDSGKGFSTYIIDLLSRCKVQKALLHCVLASVFNSRRKAGSAEEVTNLTEGIISFNEENMDVNTNETFQIKLLKMLLVIIILEDQIRRFNKSDNEPMSPGHSDWEKARVNFQQNLTQVRYINSRPIVYQGMLLSAILSALKQQHLSHMHRHWLAMVTSALPYMGRSLSHTVVSVVNQVCRNLEQLAYHYELGDPMESSGRPASKLPADHLITVLEALTTICHYCLMDNNQQISLGQPLSHHTTNINSDTATAGHILTNLIHAFNPVSSREPSPAKEVSGPMVNVMDARRGVLSILPRILASLTVLWKAIHMSEDRAIHMSEDKTAQKLEDMSRKVDNQPCWTIGAPKLVRKYILEFVSPISVHHGVNLLAAVAVVWNDRRQKGTTNTKRMLPTACEDQLLLVDLVSAIKVLPTDTMIQTIKHVIKQPPPTSQDRRKKRTPLEVSMLQFFYAYVRQTPGPQLVDSWSSLLALLKEGLQLNLPPAGQFLLLVILNEFVQKIPMFEERKDLKDLQDIAQKLLEACSTIAGSSLEQTTWLRRNLAVKPGPQIDVDEPDDAPTDQEDVPSPPVVPDKPCEHNYQQYSVQGLVMLAELITPLLDVIYSSEEKEKVVPFLNSIMHNVFPYLRNHSPHNLPSFRASSQILASLSSYPYTRKAWRREAFDLFLDLSFFQTDEICISYWHTVVDNLMTHDKTTFKDLLARVTVAQGGSLNLFSSREQEFEQRAQLLKRLSFSIFCSETDQYQRYMPDIQERLADSLRLPQVPSVQAMVFMCFRVLVLRMSPQHLTSLWPTIITELVHVLLQVEQELCPEAEDSSAAQKKKNRTQLARMANLDASWAIGNGLNAHNNPAWLQLYLAACKLLDLALVLPAQTLPQFQLYRWAFTSDPGSEELPRRGKDYHATFMPHVLRIAKLMNMRFDSDPAILKTTLGQPLLTVSKIRSLQDLHAFFNTLTIQAQSGGSFASSDQLEVGTQMHKSRSAPEMMAPTCGDSRRFRLKQAKSARQYIEQMIETDFLEPMPRV